MSNSNKVKITKTGVIVVQPWLTKSVSKNQELILNGTEYKAAVAQGFCDEEGNEKAAKTSRNKRPGKQYNPTDETK